MKGAIVKTPERNTQIGRLATARNSWREIMQSGADSGQLDGVALEHLIDLQRERASTSGEGR
jgi:hypothetical protein